MDEVRETVVSTRRERATVLLSKGGSMLLDAPDHLATHDTSIPTMSHPCAHITTLIISLRMRTQSVCDAHVHTYIQ
jgi:hypothetical protein